MKHEWLMGTEKLRQRGCVRDQESSKAGGDRRKTLRLSQNCHLLRCILKPLHVMTDHDYCIVKSELKFIF